MQEDLCSTSPLPSFIGPYKILKKIASGGMGDVFVAQDPFFHRTLALKKIREDKLDHPNLKERFIKEAKISAQLSHPNIIPIYQIHQTETELYYTMPLVEGSTLKEIFRISREQEKEGHSTHPIGSSIPMLMRIFWSICQAIAYAHSKEILHRDLKPENIIIGTYGEVLILDWGLADFVNAPSFPLMEETEEEEEEDSAIELTKPGKLAGTLRYLPPERIFGAKASYVTDIYALGVILYQMLTLRFPFYRKSIKLYKKQIKHEKFIDPSEKAPYRDIPPQLSKIAQKCLAKHPDKRYKRVEEILADLNNYIEGHAQWTPCASIQIEHKADWRFQENIIMAKHIALTQKSDDMEWVSLMIAKHSFFGNIKLETHVRIKEASQGIGFLLNLKPIEEKRDFFQDALLLWIGSENNPGCRLFRSNVELLTNPELSLQKNLSYFIKIEKTDYHIKLYIDNALAFDYLSYIPSHGPHFGLMLKDDDLEMGTILVSSSSPNIQVNCLAVPDAFLALRYFRPALSKYRQISHSFLGRAEGREAIFRAGLTLLEAALGSKEKKRKQKLLAEALEEFDELHKSPGSPLEYLGKSLVYKATHDLEEEIKCLELALRKFGNHPLIHLVKDQVLFRLHEASYKDRTAAYELALLALRQLPQAFIKQDNQKLLEHLKKNCELLPFIENDLLLHIAFWLCKPQSIVDIFYHAESLQQKENALYALLYLGYEELAKHLYQSDPNLASIQNLTAILDESPDNLNAIPEKALLYLLHKSFFSQTRKRKSLLRALDTLSYYSPAIEEKKMELLLLEEKTSTIKNILTRKKTENSSEYFFNGCLLLAEKGASHAKEIFSRSFDRLNTDYLADHFFSMTAHQKKKWFKHSFFWERIQLLKQLALIYKSSGSSNLYKSTMQSLRKEFKKIQTLS